MSSKSPRSDDDLVAAAFEHAPHGQALVAADGALLRPNRALCVLLDRPREAIVGRDWRTLLAWPDAGAAPADGGRFSARRADPGGGWLDGELRRVDAETALLTLTDRSADRLGSQQRPWVALETFPGMAYRCLNDRRWTMQFVSRGALALTGYPPEAFVRDELSYSDVVHPDDAQTLWEQVQGSVRRREPFAISYRLVTRLGQHKWVWEQGQGVFDRARLVALEGYIIDVTAERRARDTLHKSHESLSRLLDSLGDGVIATDLRERVTLINPVAEALTGYGRDEALGRPLSDVLHLEETEDGDRLDAGRRRTLVDARGDRRPVVSTSTEVKDADGLATGQVVILIRDVSKRVSIEEELRQAHKLEAIGRLAGGVAHDFNNLLTGIMGYADLLHTELAGKAPLDHFAEVILETSRRAADLTTELLAFSRRRKLTRARVDLHRVIDAAIALLARTTDRRVVIQTRFEAALSTVSGDRTALQGALLNLGLNAADAMPAGGTLTYATGLRDVDATTGAVRGVAPGSYIELEIIDTGGGIPDTHLERIFEPFFTSKETGEGTGLGLAAVYGTVAAHDGNIRARNRPEGGACFSLLLPLDTSIGPHAEGAALEEAIVTGSGLLLLAEDEDVVRRLLAEVLTQLGYTVVTARDGVEAVSLFSAQADEYDLVLLDLRMPRMSGEEALALLIERAPAVRILVSSGLDVGSPFPPQVRGVLAKPFTLAELSRSVADAIAR